MENINGFMVTGEMLNDLKLNGNTLLVYAYVTHCRNAYGRKWISKTEVARVLNISRGTVVNIYKELEERGLF